MSFRSSVSALNHDCAARILSIPRKVPAEFPTLTLVAVSRAARQGEGLPRRPDPDSVSFEGGDATSKRACTAEMEALLVRLAA
jgi:hypothetical protein